MPTPLSSILGGASSSAQRRETYVLTSSNASFPIPSWARGGKGIVYVTGCGGGGGSSTSTGGLSGAWARQHPLIIPSGATTMGLTIGAGGPAGTAGGGGSTEIAIGGTNILRLTGGTGNSNAPQSFVSPSLWGAANSQWRSIAPPVNSSTAFAALFGWFQPGISIGSGWGGQDEASGGDGPFGVSWNAASNAIGYGAGASSFNGAGYAGAPGFLILTFVEGL